MLTRYYHTHTSPASPHPNTLRPPKTRPSLIQRQRRALRLVYFKSAAVKLCTTLVPSWKRVRNIRFAFWNMPSFKLTTMNWLPLNLVLISRPIFCVCDKSNAASTSSRIYIGAGLNCSRARMRESAISELRRHVSQRSNQQVDLHNVDEPLASRELSE